MKWEPRKDWFRKRTWDLVEYSGVDEESKRTTLYCTHHKWLHFKHVQTQTRLSSTNPKHLSLHPPILITSRNLWQWRHQTIETLPMATTTTMWRHPASRQRNETWQILIHSWHPDIALTVHHLTKVLANNRSIVSNSQQFVSVPLMEDFSVENTGCTLYSQHAYVQSAISPHPEETTVEHKTVPPLPTLVV